MDRFTGGTAKGRPRMILEEPVRRIGKPEEIAEAVIWLCSDASRFVIGSAMVTNGLTFHAGLYRVTILPE